MFKLERPHYADYPEDALVSLRNLFRKQLADPYPVAIMAEEDFEVVGMCSWILPRGSPEKASFGDVHRSPLEPARDRDLDQHQLELVDSIKEQGEHT